MQSCLKQRAHVILTLTHIVADTHRNAPQLITMTCELPTNPQIFALDTTKLKNNVMIQISRSRGT